MGMEGRWKLWKVLLESVSPSCIKKWNSLTEKEESNFEKRKQHVPEPGEGSWACRGAAGALGATEARGL